VSLEALVGTDFSQDFAASEGAPEDYGRAFRAGSFTYRPTLLHLDGTLPDVLYNASVHRDLTQTCSAC
jgi:hypothetical protein